MSRRRYAKTPDANEAAIVDALREAGCNVSRIEGRSGSAGVPDLLVEYTNPALKALAAELAYVARRRDVRVDGHPEQFLDDAVARLRAHVRQFMVMEVKNPKSGLSGTKAILARDLVVGGKYHGMRRYCSERTARICKTSQGDFFLAHTAPMAVVTSVEEALAAVGIEVES